jgi:intein/homing endonuclease
MERWENFREGVQNSFENMQDTRRERRQEIIDNARAVTDRLYEQRQERIENIRDLFNGHGMLQNNRAGNGLEKFLDAQRDRIQQNPLFHRDSSREYRPLFERSNDNNGLFRSDGWKGWGNRR